MPVSRGDAGWKCAPFRYSGKAVSKYLEPPVPFAGRDVLIAPYGIGEAVLQAKRSAIGQTKIVASHKEVRI